MTTQDINKLHKMKLNELQAKFAEVIGEATRSPNRTYLIRRITEAIATTEPTGAHEAAPSPVDGKAAVAQEATMEPGLAVDTTEGSAAAGSTEDVLPPATVAPLT